MKNQLSIQEKLEDLRKERGLKQDVVATAVGITISTLSKYENKDNKAIILMSSQNLQNTTMFLWNGLPEIQKSER